MVTNTDLDAEKEWAVGTYEPRHLSLFKQYQYMHDKVLTHLCKQVRYKSHMKKKVIILNLFILKK